MKCTLVSLAVAATLTGCSINAIQTPDAVTHPSQIVRYDDLDLDDSADVRVFYERVELAARDVCGPARANDVAQLWVRPCVQRAVSRALADVDVPTLKRIDSRGATEEPVCRQAERRVVVRPRGGNPNKRANVARVETRIVTVCGDEIAQRRSSARKQRED
jgi:UrcA family protein